MTINGSRNDMTLEALTSQALTLAMELSLSLDREGCDLPPATCQVRNLAVLSFSNISKILVLLLEKDETAQ